MAPERRSFFLRDPAFLPPLLAVICALFIAGNCTPVAPRQTRLWAGYYTVAVRHGSDAAHRLPEVAPGLSAGHQPVSVSTAPASMTDFEGIVRFPAAELDRRLDHADPRFDPWLRGLEGYFTSGEWEVTYVPSFRSAISVFSRLALSLGLPGRGSWRLVDLGAAEALVTLAGALAVAALLWLSLEHKRGEDAAALAAFLLVWLPCILGGGVALFSLFFLFLGAWMPLMRECGRRARESAYYKWSDPSRKRMEEKLFSFAAAASVLPLLLAVLGGAQPPGVRAVAEAIVLSGLLLAVPFPLHAVRGANGRRRRFEPVPILAAEGPPPASGRGPVLAALLAVSALAVVSAVGGMRVPAPHAVPGQKGGFSWESVAVKHPQSGLPGFPAFVAHAAYQESLGFAETWAVPTRDERVSITEYLWDPATRTVTERLRTVKTYDSPWLASVIRAATPGSVEGMLVEQGRPVTVRLEGPASRVLRDMPFAAACLGILGLWLFAPKVPVKVQGRKREKTAGRRKDSRAPGRSKETKPTRKSSGRGERALISGKQSRFNGSARRNQTP